MGNGRPGPVGWSSIWGDRSQWRGTGRFRTPVGCGGWGTLAGGFARLGQVGCRSGGGAGRRRKRPEGSGEWVFRLLINFNNRDEKPERSPSGIITVQILVATFRVFNCCRFWCSKLIKVG